MSTDAEIPATCRVKPIQETQEQARESEINSKQISNAMRDIENENDRERERERERGERERERARAKKRERCPACAQMLQGIASSPLVGTRLHVSGVGFGVESLG